MKTAKLYPNNVKECIKRQGYTLQEVANEIGISRRTLTSYVSGKVPFPRHYLEKVADLIKCNIAELMTQPANNEEIHQSKISAISNPNRFNLKIELDQVNVPSPYGHTAPQVKNTVFIISILNTGTVPSYINSIGIGVIIDGKICEGTFYDFINPLVPLPNPEHEKPLEPGQKRNYPFSAPELSIQLKRLGENMFPKEVYVHDQIGNRYKETISDDLATWLLSFPSIRKL